MGSSDAQGASLDIGLSQDGVTGADVKLGCAFEARWMSLLCSGRALVAAALQCGSPLFDPTFNSVLPPFAPGALLSVVGGSSKVRPWPLLQLAIDVYVHPLVVERHQTGNLLALREGSAIRPRQVLVHPPVHLD